MHTVQDLLIDAPVEGVFELLSDPVHRPSYQFSLARVEVLTEGPPQVGTRWRDVLAFGAGTVELEITEYVPNVLWAERALSGPMQGDIRLQFLAVGDKTGLRVTADGRIQGVLSRFDGIAGPMFATAVRADLRSLERLLRTGPAARRLG